MAHVKTFVVTCTLANTAYNVVTGTTTGPTAAQCTTDTKGREVTFQNRNTAAVSKVGASDVVTNEGITLSAAYGHTITLGKGSTPSGIHLGDFWVTSDTALATVVVQLIKAA